MSMHPVSKARIVVVLLFLFQGVTPLPALAAAEGASSPSFQFARGISQESLVSDPAQQEAFTEQILKAESRFHQPGIAYNAESGLTYDGISIDFATGKLLGGPRNWSAASKEGLHITLLCLALAGNEKAKLFVSAANPGDAANKALDLLAKKIASFEKFNRDYPGFGGFLPWFTVSNDGMAPAWDWRDRMPSLDNGQLAWALFLAADVLEEQGASSLARRYRDYWRLLAKNAVPIFYDARAGKIRGVAKIKAVQGSVEVSNYGGDDSGYFLTDAYEGELMALFMTLFGSWQSPEDVRRVWQGKTIAQAAYHTQEGKTIMVRRGFLFSAQESWNFLVLPYMDDPLIRMVYENGEKVRTWHSAEKKIPGLMASISRPADGNEPLTYAADCGIPSVAQQPISHQDIVAPYAAFPTLLADRKAGLAWLRVMLAGPRMLGPYGMTESASTDGRKIAPLLTWDGKATTVLALIGNPVDPMREALKRAGKYEDFLERVSREYAGVFSEKALEGRDLAFRLPTAEIPLNLSDFEAPLADAVTEVLATARFQGGGPLFTSYEKSGAVHRLSAEPGYVWTTIPRTDVAAQHFLNFTVRQDRNREKVFFLELKNCEDHLITGNKIRIEVPDTGREFATFSIDVAPALAAADSTACILVFSDPALPLEFKSVSFSAQPVPGSDVLVASDGRYHRENGASGQNTTAFFKGLFKD